MLSCAVPLRRFALRVSLAVLAVAGTARAQPDAPGPFTHRAWTMEDGLPQNSTFGITQTRDGYLWLATLQGLVRFDGHRFTAFHASEHPGLDADRMIGLFEDRSGALWAASDRGLVRFQPAPAEAGGAFVTERRTGFDRPRISADALP